MACMKRVLLWTAALCCLISTGCVTTRTSATANAPEPLPRIDARGLEFVADGEPIELRGVNLGNWLLIERWMLRYPKDAFTDEFELRQILADRFGQNEADRLMRVYRDHWITEADFARLKTYGFNCVRVPLAWWDVLEPTWQTSDIALRDEAFVWTDRVLRWAEKHGLYVFFDLHAAPGGQSTAAHAGRAGQNKLWTDAAAQEATIAFWQAMAERYKDRTSIAAFDLINEPYGNHQDDITPQLKTLCERIVPVIRAAGSDHVILLPGTAWRDVSFYEPPVELGWTNVGFTVHHYPGRYGEPRTREAMDRELGPVLDFLQDMLVPLGGPMLLGEFNAYFHSLTGPDLLAEQFEAYTSRGWAATMWSWKMVTPDEGIEDSQFAVLLSSDGVLPRPDLQTASAGEIERYFRSLSSENFIDDETLRTALTRDRPETP
ncbi:MAG: cellulase family glycosylhydrolase [Planctomycetota bacterium]